jgi:hypothetical protein
LRQHYLLTGQGGTYPAPYDRSDANLAALIDEVRLLRGAVEDMSRRLADLERENCDLREAVGSFAGRELKPAERLQVETLEGSKTVRDLFSARGTRVLTGIAPRTRYCLGT